MPDLPSVLLCQFDSLEYYSYMILSARLTEANIKHDIEIIDSDSELLNKLSSEYSEYSIIGFYTCNTDYPRIVRISKEIKKNFKDKVLILGGPYPTLNPLNIDFNIIDFICIGAGEFYFHKWISEGRWEVKENYQNFVCDLSKPYKVLFVTDLDKSPKPNRDIYYKKYDFMKNMGIRRFLFSSGCPYRCSYCHNASFREKYKEYFKAVLFKSPEKAIQDMKEVLERYPSYAISFSDDNFCINRKWLSEFLNLYKSEINKPFNMSTTINILTDDIIEELSRANLKTVRIAMETTNQKIRKEILNRPDYSNEDFEYKAAKLRNHGIKVVMLNMFCLPGQTLRDCVDAFKFARKNRVVMNTNILVPYKGTAIFSYCLDNDLLIDPSAAEGDLYSSGSSLKGEDMERMVTLQNYTFLLNYFNFFIPLILLFSKSSFFRNFSLRFIAPLNIAIMTLFQYTGLMPLSKIVVLGVKSFSAFKRKK